MKVAGHQGGACGWRPVALLGAWPQLLAAGSPPMKLLPTQPSGAALDSRGPEPAPASSPTSVSLSSSEPRGQPGARRRVP